MTVDWEIGYGPDSEDDQLPFTDNSVEKEDDDNDEGNDDDEEDNDDDEDDENDNINELEGIGHKEEHIYQWYDVNGNVINSHSEVKLNFFTKIFKPSSRNSNEVNLTNLKEWGKYIRRLEGSYTGNEGNTIITEYSKYLLVVWPKSFDVEFQIKTSSAQKVINNLRDEVFKDKDDSNAELRSRFDALMSYFSRQTNSLDYWTNISLLEMIKRIGKLEHAKIFLEKFRITFDDYEINNIIGIISHFGIKHLKENLEFVFKNSDKKPYAIFQIFTV